MNQAGAGTRALLHLSITGEDRRLDLGVPAQVPLVELLPGVVRGLGVLDPTLVHGGFVLRRADGSDLDPAASCAAQGVRDGELLTLVRGGLLAEHRRYDDVVEAVIDATRDHQRPWTPTDRARTALAVSLILLGLGAWLLVAAPGGLGAASLTALGAAAVLVATGAVLTRVGQPEAGNGFGLAAAVYAGVGAWLLAPAGVLWGWPLAFGAAGAVVAGGLALATTGTTPQVHLVPIVAGLGIGTASAIAALIGPGSVAPYAVLVAVLGAASNSLPWLALSSTRIRVISPLSEAEVLAVPPPVDGEQVALRAAQGHALLLALRIAIGLAVLVATPLVATSGIAGALLCTLTFAGMMSWSRQVHGRTEVATLMAIGTVGLALTGAVVARAGTVDRTVLLVVLLAATVALVGLTLLSTSTRVRLVRVFDTVELAGLALLLPLGAIAAGLA
jgi:type VII secretion integral membrane protein EccD